MTHKSSGAHCRTDATDTDARACTKHAKSEDKDKLTEPAPEGQNPRPLALASVPPASSKTMHAPRRVAHLSASAAGAAAPEVDGRVVHEVPDPLADEDVLALVDLGRLDELLLQRGGQPPIDHVAGALLLVGSQDEASIVRSQAGGEHARTPRPPGLHELRGALGPLDLVQGLDVLARVQGLLLARVGDLRDGRHLEVRRVADATEVAIAHGENAALAPDGTAVHRRLVDHLEVLVEVDPAATAWALVAQDLLGHEVVGGLHADADVGLRGAVRELDLLPEIVALGVVLRLVELLDLDLVHVLRAVVRGAVRQGAEAPVQEVDDRELELGEEVLQLRDPLDADEAGAHHEDRGLLLVEIRELVVLLQDVAAPALDEALVDVRPIADLPALLVHGGEPEGLAHWLEGPEVAARADDAVVVSDVVRAREHGLHVGNLVLGIEALDLTPDELHTRLPLQDRLQGEGQGIKVARLHEGAEHAGSVLEVLLGIHDRHVEALLQLPRAECARELAADHKNLALAASHGSWYAEARNSNELAPSGT
eukprot:CAMPEP_0113822170 /NCGR_PEP_ID=MMETSP0328-20130328/2107_1 /TAXON_ID=39455 /ORGANISM="Alexandrium minutum" /LENGTH=538 /DNA_ID=CAMNT_0000790107 /DNA_START=31 /DNA_END=1648 /DNA_ORIENTATION=+ /assembly_acc=CAM_ASM_000350